MASVGTTIINNSFNIKVYELETMTARYAFFHMLFYSIPSVAEKDIEYKY